MEKRNCPHLRYDKPHMEVIEIVHSFALLQASQDQNGRGHIPNTNNNNIDDDWED